MELEIYFFLSKYNLQGGTPYCDVRVREHKKVGNRWRGLFLTWLWLYFSLTIVEKTWRMVKCKLWRNLFLLIKWKDCDAIWDVTFLVIGEKSLVLVRPRRAEASLEWETPVVERYDLR